MGAYMYPIIIKREPQIKTVYKSKNLGYNPELTIDMLFAFGLKRNSYFVIEENDDKTFSISFQVDKVETKSELNKRVKAEEDYMKRYNEYHGK